MVFLALPSLMVFWTVNQEGLAQDKVVGNPTWHGMVGNYPGCWYLWETLFSEMTPEFSAFLFQTLHKFGQGAKTGFCLWLLKGRPLLVRRDTS